MVRPISVCLRTALSGVVLAFGMEAAGAQNVDGASASMPAAQPVEQEQSVSPVALDDVKRAFEQRFAGIQVKALRPTPLAGLFEVQVDMELMYTDAKAEYVLQGSLIDARARVDLTAQQLLKLSQVPFESLPLDLAIKQVKGNGQRKIAVFEDPNCGYCKQLHKTLESVDNITVYTLLFPILSPDSTTKSRDIWCASDQAAAWRAWMLDGKTPPQAQCDTPVEQILALGRQLMVRGTPAIIFADGSRVNGALPLDALNRKLAEVRAN